MLEKFQELGVDCEMRDALLFASERASKLVCGAYVRTVTVAPKVFGLAYRAGGAISSGSAQVACVLRQHRLRPRPARVY